MNIFVQELRANLKSLLIWGVIVVLFIALGSSKFSAYAGNPEMLAILGSMPQALLDAFNMRAFNLTTITGFFGVMFTYFALILSIAAAMWGSDIISKEERDKTAEFILTLPVTRSRLVTAKTLAALVNCIGLLFITWGASLVSAASYHPDSTFYHFLRLCMLALFIIQLTFLAIGIFLGCALKRYKLANSVAVSLLLGTYFLSIISSLDKDLEFLKYLSPFKYFDASVLLFESRIDPFSVGLSLAIILLCMVGAYLTYTRKDLYI
ncbi:MAG: ABC transporter permease subunit [Chloroflexi bacterium]|nr:ABC transporter permease subunit [Chloroflexota bacterium]